MSAFPECTETELYPVAVSPAAVSRELVSDGPAKGITGPSERPRPFASDRRRAEGRYYSYSQPQTCPHTPSR